MQTNNSWMHQILQEINFVLNHLKMSIGRNIRCVYQFDSLDATHIIIVIDTFIHRPENQRFFYCICCCKSIFFSRNKIKFTQKFQRQ